MVPLPVIHFVAIIPNKLSRKINVAIAASFRIPMVESRESGYMVLTINSILENLVNDFPAPEKCVKEMWVSVWILKNFVGCVLSETLK